MGTKLSNLLSSAIADKVTDDLTESDIISELGEAAGITSGTVNQILSNDIDCPPLVRLEGFSDYLGIALSSLVESAESDGCSYDEERSLLKRLWNKFFGKDEKVEHAISLSNLDEKVWEAADRKYPQAWVHSTFTDSTGNLFTILSSNGKLYKTPVTILEDDEIELGEWQQVVQEFNPIQTRTTIIRQLDGKTRWISRSATSTLNRSGEIDSRSLFQSFVTHIEETEEYPIRQFYHKGEQFRTGQADFVQADENVLITSGIFDDTPLANVEIAAREANPVYWGESIGFLPEDGELVQFNEIEIPVYTSGILREISTLPEREAASLFTLTYQMEVNRMLKGKAREAFNQLFTQSGQTEEDAEKWLQDNVDDLNRSIEDNGLVTRSIEQDLIEAVKAGDIKKAQEIVARSNQQEELEEEVVEQDVIIDDDLLQVIIDRTSEPIQGLQERVDSLSESVATAIETLTTNQAALVESLAGLESKLTRTKEEERKEWVNDLPAVPKVPVVRYQPRQEQDKEVEVNSNDIANGTLDSIGLKY